MQAKGEVRKIGVFLHFFTVQFEDVKSIWVKTSFYLVKKCENRFIHLHIPNMACFRMINRGIFLPLDVHH